MSDLAVDPRINATNIYRNNVVSLVSSVDVSAVFHPEPI